MRYQYVVKMEHQLAGWGIVDAIEEIFIVLFDWHWVGISLNVSKIPEKAFSEFSHYKTNRNKMPGNEY